MTKKNIFKTMIAIVAALSMSATVMAAGSIIGAIDMPKVSSSAGSVTLQAVTENTYDPELQAVVDKLNSASAGMTVLDAFGGTLPNIIGLYGANGLVSAELDMSEYKFLSPVMEMQLTGVEPTAENPVRVTFVVNSLTDNIEVDVLHFCEEHQWEVLKGERVSDNQIAADFHSASPVALIYKEKASALGSDAVSPQTGESENGSLALFAALMAGIGVFAVIKRRKAV